MRLRNCILLFSALLSSVAIGAEEDAAENNIEIIEVSSVDDLEKIFSQYDYHWPPESDVDVPAILLKKFPDDWPVVQVVKRKKELFLRVLLPMVLAENRRIHEQRMLLSLILSGPSGEDDSALVRWVGSIAKDYGVDKPFSDEGKTRLLRHFDIIPHGLVLAQAAIETGWGSSRFLQQGNSLFGQWTWTEQGIVPDGRDSGLKHRVKSFNSLHLAVRDYLHNLNTGHAYEQLRLMREQMRSDGRSLSALQLAGGLAKYSARGDDYVEELRTIMQSNQLTHLSELVLTRKNNTIHLSRR